jgi:predicted transcriptional regulator
MYISQVKECQSSEIERGANLRQPEVSVAMQVLSDLGWVSKRNQKKGGKGRPIYIYKLKASLDDIIEHYESEKLKEIETIKNDLTELKTLLQEMKTG